MWKRCPAEVLQIPADRAVCGVVTLVPGARHGPVALTRFMLFWVMQAPEGGWVTVNGQKHVLETGMLVLGYPGMEWEYAFGPGRPSVHFYLHFDLEDPDGEWPAPSTWPAWRQLPQESPLPGMIRQLAGTLQMIEPQRSALSCSLLQLVLHGAIYGTDVAVGEVLPPLPDGVSRAAALALKPGTEWKVAALAKAVGMHPDHLSRLFQSSLGLSLAKFLVQVRVDRAITLMQEGEGTVEEIAWKSGFFDAAHFSKAFRDVMGCPPARYREQMRQRGVLQGPRLRPLLRLNLQQLAGASPPGPSVNTSGIAHYLERVAASCSWEGTGGTQAWKQLPLGAGTQDAIVKEGGWFWARHLPLDLLPRGKTVCAGVPFHVRWGSSSPKAVALGQGGLLRWKLEVPAETDTLWLLVAAGRAGAECMHLGGLRLVQGRRIVRAHEVVLAGRAHVSDVERASSQDKVVLQDWWHSYPVRATAHARPWVLLDPLRPYLRKHSLYVVRLQADTGFTALEWKGERKAPGSWMVLAAVSGRKQPKG